MTQNSPKPEQQNQQSQSSLQNGHTTPSSASDQSRRYISLQKETPGEQTQLSWWQKQVARWNNISFRNKLSIIVLGSVTFLLLP